MSVGIEIRWVDRRTGRDCQQKTSEGKQNLSFVESETLTSSSSEAFVKVAQNIVDAMEEDW